MITILTESLPTAAKRLFRKMLPKSSLSAEIYGGHPAVTRSLLDGLKKINADFNYNPPVIKDVGETIVVLSGIAALRQAIKLKKQGRIKKLLAGPNLMVFSTEFNNILSSKEIDVCLVPSDWVRIAYEEDSPALAGRIKSWPAGVDENFWQPDNALPKNKVLVYQKNAPEELTEKVLEKLKVLNFETTEIIYNKYKVENFKKTLAESSLAIFLSRSESQGIALQEAWAMDVPTFCWQPGELTINNRKYSTFSSCPYLTDATGKQWKTIEDLEKLLIDFKTKKISFAPRNWIENNLTDQLSAQKLLDIINTVLSLADEKQHYRQFRAI
jgi:hypothetical protein